MSFNIGWLCPKCGPVPDSKKRSVNKVQYDTCKECASMVTKWQRPLNEREGRCNNCGEASFKLAIVKKQLVRCCKHCNEALNTDTNKIIRKGENENGYSSNN